MYLINTCNKLKDKMKASQQGNRNYKNIQMESLEL